MRATQRITWLLLTTGVLFHINCTADDSAPSSTNATVFTASPTVATASKDTVQTSPTVDTKVAVGTTGTPPVAKTTAPTQAPSTAVPTPSATITATAKPTDNTTPTQPTAANVPTNHPAASSASSGAPVTKPDISTTVTAGPTPAKTLDSAATTASSSGSSSSSSSSSSGGLAVSTSAPTTQTSNAPGVDLHGTGAPVTPQGAVQGNVGTTKSSTDAAPSGAPTTSHTAISSGTSQQAGKGGTEKMTVTVMSPQPTASRTAPPPVNTGTTLSTPTKSVDISGSRTEAPAPLTTTTITAAQTNIFQYSLNAKKEKDEKKELVEVCRQLMVNMQDGNCTLTWRHHNGKVQFDRVEINGKVKTSLATEIYEDITKAQTDNKTLIAILASCGALLIMIVILAVCASHHRKPYHENQQHLTEELHTVENGYHDNPTLEVMEVQPEMQEKKMALNGEFNDSWIVPIDNLLKEDIPDEEDTHL